MRQSVSRRGMAVETVGSRETDSLRACGRAGPGRGLGAGSRAAARNWCWSGKAQKLAASDAAISKMFRPSGTTSVVIEDVAARNAIKHLDGRRRAVGNGTRRPAIRGRAPPPGPIKSPSGCEHAGARLACPRCHPCRCRAANRRKSRSGSPVRRQQADTGQPATQQRCQKGTHADEFIRRIANPGSSGAG